MENENLRPKGLKNFFGQKNIVERTITALKAAKIKGDAIAQYNLGVCYYNGNGVAKDQAEAVKWWRKDAEQGHEEAKYELKRLGK